VGRWLEALGSALHVNAKTAEARAAHVERNAQCAQMTAPRQVFQAAGWPLIRVDTKKPAWIGNCKHAGQAWSQAAEVVNVHDVPQEALGRAVP
jgi:hypothetical protein